MNHESKSYERHAELFQSFDGPCSVLTYCRYAPGSVFCNVQHSICIRGGYLIYSWKIYQWRSQRSNRQSWNPVLCRRLNESCKKEKSGCRIRITCQLSDLAFIATAKKEKKAATKAQVIPATLTASLVGVTEPLEFTFLFAAPMLWVIYSVMDGLFQMIVYLLNVRVCATNGIIDFLVLNLPAGIGRTHWPMYVVAGLIEIVVMYFLVRFLIVKFNLKTPGREDGEDVIDLAANAAAVKSQIRSGNKAEAKKEADAETAARIIEGLGGPDNIENIGNCMTRLRVEVKDASVVKDKEWFAPTGAAGLVVKGNNIQIIYGPVISKKRSIVEKALGREE